MKYTVKENIKKCFNTLICRDYIVFKNKFYEIISCFKKKLLYINLKVTYTKSCFKKITFYKNFIFVNRFRFAFLYAYSWAKKITFFRLFLRILLVFSTLPKFYAKKHIFLACIGKN